MTEELGWIAPDAPLLDEQRFGTKAALLSRGVRAGLPIPPGFVIPADHDADLSEDVIAAAFDRLAERSGEPAELVSIRASSIGPGSDVVPAVLNIGASGAAIDKLAGRYDARLAFDLKRRLLHSFGVGVMGIDEEEFEYALYDLMRDLGVDGEAELTADHLAQLSETYAGVLDEVNGTALPDAVVPQTCAALRAMAQSWNTPRTLMRRQARGFAADSPLARIVQVMALGLGTNAGAGVAHLRDATTGAQGLTGRYLANAQGNEALMGLRTPSLITRSEREAREMPDPSLEELFPEAVLELQRIGRQVEAEIGECYSLDFTLTEGKVQILELVPLKCSARAAVQIAVDLAEAGAITRADALLRIGPTLVDEHLHPTIDPTAARDLIGHGLPASPGAAAGKLVFSPDTAEEAAESGERVLLALVETSPEDIRGMHAAGGVLTVRGGMTSHAAVVARGLGKPCVVGAKDMTLNRVERTLTSPDGRVFKEGDVVTVDGGEGQVLAGKVPTLEPEITGAFAQIMEWADKERTLDVRTNADTARDAGTALGFAAQGIGLCRTEHMFFQDHRISAMRQMILAETEEERRDALAKLLPMQRGDFHDLFVRMQGMPVVIRLLDPPLHEFLPHGQAEIDEMANELSVTPQKIRARALELAEFNPMLGNRGCRIGIAYPEIYQMQLRALFEAVCHAANETGEAAKPEIMIPLVSAVREFDLLKREVEEMAQAVSAECGVKIDYTIGVMIETPRACLRSGDIAALADFLSFGTNDLTQMLYGLSRDDAGRFIPNYVERGVFEHDPFHQIDEEGVGEIMKIGIERARARAPHVTIGLCGEHGGDPASIDFCHRAGFDYVSCSPYRVPVARLAAAQAAIRARR
ncbi:MAG: pyruvate, phosphate dikinase [Pseudomonadota bacterium]